MLLHTEHSRIFFGVANGVRCFQRVFRRTARCRKMPAAERFSGERCHARRFRAYLRFQLEFVQAAMASFLCAAFTVGIVIAGAYLLAKIAADALEEFESVVRNAYTWAAAFSSAFSFGTKPLRLDRGLLSSRRNHSRASRPPLEIFRISASRNISLPSPPWRAHSTTTIT